MAYQYKISWEEIPDDMVEEEIYDCGKKHCDVCSKPDKIKKGDKFVCLSDVVMDGAISEGEIAYITGKVYVSEEDGCITDEQGHEDHMWDKSKYPDDPHWSEYFQRYEKKPDRDYFQSVQDEHGKSPDVTSATEWRITEECNALKDLLISKNRKYGDSALDTGVFNISPIVALKARIQDKLNRLKNDNKDEDEDIVLDLLGYFILLRIAIKEERENRDF